MGSFWDMLIFCFTFIYLNTFFRSWKYFKFFNNYYRPRFFTNDLIKNITVFKEKFKRDTKKVESRFSLLQNQMELYAESLEGGSPLLGNLKTTSTIYEENRCRLLMAWASGTSSLGGALVCLSATGPLDKSSPGYWLPTIQQILWWFRTLSSSLIDSMRVNYLFGW